MTGTKRTYILTGEVVDVTPPPNHLVLNIMGDEDRHGEFVIPERVSESTAPFDDRSFEDTFPEVLKIFSDKEPRNISTLKSQRLTLQVCINRMREKFEGIAGRYMDMQKRQREAVLSLMKFINAKISSQDEILKEHENELQKIKHESLEITDKDIRKSLLTVRNDSSGYSDTLENYIDTAAINKSIQFIRIYLQPGNSELDNAVTSAATKLHLARSQISSLEETESYTSITNLGGKLYVYDQDKKISKLLQNASDLYGEFSNRVTEIEKHSPDSFQRLDIEIRTRDWVSEIASIFHRLKLAQKECFDKKQDFNSKIFDCTKTLLSVNSNLSTDNCESEIASRFKDAQDALRQLKFARNLTLVYKNCLEEKRRRFEEFGDIYRRFVAGFNEEMECIITRENRRRRAFLNEQQKLLGGHDIPMALAPRIDQLLEAPQIDPNIEADNDVMDANHPEYLSASTYNPSQNIPTIGSGDLAVQNKEFQDALLRKDSIIEEQRELIQNLKENLEISRQEFVESKKQNDIRFSDLYNKYLIQSHEKEELKKQIETLVRDLQESQNKVILLEGNLTVDNTEKNKRLAVLTEELTRLHSERQKLQMVGSENLRKIEQLEAEKEEVKKIVSTLHEELKKKEAELKKSKSTHIDEHRHWYEKEQKLQEDIQKLNSKLSTIQDENKQKIDVMLELTEQNQKLKTQVTELNRANTKNQSTNEKNLQARIAELENESKFMKEKMHQTIQNSAKSIDMFKDNLRAVTQTSIRNAWTLCDKHMKTVQKLKDEKTSTLPQVLSNLRYQLETISQTMTCFIQVITTATYIFADFTQFCRMINDSREVILNVCESLTRLTENGGSQQDSWIVVSNDLSQEEQPSQGSVKPEDPEVGSRVLFKKPDNCNYYVSCGDGPEYYLDPDSLRAFEEKYGSGAKDHRYINGKVIQVIQRSVSDDPYNLHKNYKTLLVEIEE